jgi:ABC-type transport system involved in multi-copper enzyme maturation permease subunit
MWALIVDSLREIYARKVIIGIVVIEVVTLSITALILFSDAMQRDFRDARLSRVEMRDASGTPGARAKAGGAAPAQPTHEDTLLLGYDSAGAASDIAPDTSRSRALEEVAPEAPPGGDGGSGELVLLEKVKSGLAAFALPTLLATFFLGIFATSGIVPSMMEKGTIDLLLSKPLPRWKILWGRAAGGAIAVGTNLLLFTTALCTLYGSATGIWYLPFIGLTFVLGFAMFLVLFSGIVALNVTTESSVLPMSLAYIHLIVLSQFLTNRDATIFRWVETPFLQTLISGLYYALPQTNDVLQQAFTGIFTGTVLDWSPLLQGAIFATAMIALATWRFQRKDF